LKLSNGEPFLTLEYGDITDFGSISRLLQKYQPEFFYNFAAQSHVRVSFDMPEYTMQTVATGALNSLEAIRQFSPDTRYYNAGSSEQFGDAVDWDGFQRETTPFRPNSPYAIAKVSAFHTTRLYREAYNIFSCSGICFNHEGPRRLETFVTRKITKYVAELYLHKLYNSKHPFPSLQLGNLDASRDWGYAGDTARAAYLMLNAQDPADYVVATGQTHSIKEFLDIAFSEIEENWEEYVTFDENLLRPKEVPHLKGDAVLIKKQLGWKPQITFMELVSIMLKHDIDTLRTNYASR